jgi:hypothetical protein
LEILVLVAAVVLERLVVMVLLLVAELVVLVEQVQHQALAGHQ